MVYYRYREFPPHLSIWVGASAVPTSTVVGPVVGTSRTSLAGGSRIAVVVAVGRVAVVAGVAVAVVAVEVAGSGIAGSVVVEAIPALFRGGRGNLS